MIDVVHILNTHFSTNWNNENLRERVIEFGESVRNAAYEDAAKKVEGLALWGDNIKSTAAAIRALAPEGGEKNGH